MLGVMLVYIHTINNTIAVFITLSFTFTVQIRKLSDQGIHSGNNTQECQNKTKSHHC